MLRWELTYDDTDNPILEATSACHDDGVPFVHRIKQSPANGLFRLLSDGELLPYPRRSAPAFRLLRQAMKRCEQWEEEFLQSCTTLQPEVGVTDDD